MSDVIVSKQCSKCNTVKPTSEFYKDRSKPDGLTTVCKECKNATVKAYRNTPQGRQVKQQSGARYRKGAVGKAARRRYKKGEAGKAARKRWLQSENGQEVMQRAFRKYRHSVKGQETVRNHYRKNKSMIRERQKQYDQTERGKEVKRQVALQQRKKYPERIRARRAIRDAIRDGIIPPANTLTCRYCGAKAKQYHHPSYEREHWLTVIPLCRECHAAIHYPAG